MAGGVNKVILIGNLGKDPEVRYLENGIAVARFTLATSENFKDRTSGERRTVTEWHNIVLWRGLAEIAEKFLKREARYTLRENSKPVSTKTRKVRPNTSPKYRPTT